MKVILANNAIEERGGAERVMLKIAKHYDAKIITCRYDMDSSFPEFGELEIEVLGKGSGIPFLPKKANDAISYGMTFYNTKITEDYDFINAHMSPSEWLRKRNERVLWYCHTPPRIVYDRSVASIKKRSLKSRAAFAPLVALYKRVENGIAPQIEGVAVNSLNTKKRLEDNLHLSPVVINPGVDYSEYKDNGDEKYFLYPSRIAEEKRQDYAINAFNKFTELRGKKDYKLVIAGSLSKRHKEFGSYFESLRKISNKNVIFSTNLTDQKLKELYSKCTAVLYTPINEDFGIVPLEGMASRKPVLAVNEGGPKETVLDGKTGFLSNSPSEMAKRMLYLTKNESAASALGKNGRKRVEKYYSWDAFMEKFDKLARKVAKGT
jgi:glycosyltransferase involved in cell wall biosynthesis